MTSNSGYDIYRIRENSNVDVVGLGSALLDFTVKVHESLLDELGLEKGQMHLVDEVRSSEIFKRIQDYSVESTPGGSSANTMAGIANMGGASVFISKVGNDENGDYYISESEKAGVITKLSRLDRMTGHAITFITDDSERTFATHLGAAVHFNVDDISESIIAGAKILHIEGYLLEGTEQNKACIKAMNISKENNVKISIDLADPALILRNFESFSKIISEYADIVFVNEDEAKAFTGKEGKDALSSINKMADVAVVKLGKEGSLVGYSDRVYEIPPCKTIVVNTNGAGDMYAAGFLYGITKGYNLEKSGLMASFAASKVVAQVGARLSEKLDFSGIC